MSLQLIQSIPLATTTKEAWRSVGGVPMRRDRTAEELRRSANQFVATVNLGRSRAEMASWPVPLFNSPAVVEAVLTPGATRRHMGDLLPPTPQTYPTFAWVKKPGRGGRGKKIVRLPARPVIPASWDIQLDISGDQYRVITVGHKCVQSHLRLDTVLDDERDYEWVGLNGTPGPVLSAARLGSRKLDNEFSVIGWDIMWDGDQAYILEGNSCPGINFATAERIWKSMRELINA